MDTLPARVVDMHHPITVQSWAKAANSGLWGVIHKATTGASGKGSFDPKYKSRRKGAMAAGLLWGAYHYGTKAKVSDQVENFLRVARPNDETLVGWITSQTQRTFRTQ